MPLPWRSQLDRRSFMKTLAPLAVCLPGLSLAQSPPPAAAAAATGTPAKLAQAAAQVVAQYAVIVHSGYQDTLDAARELQAAITRLIAAPAEGSLAGARKAWLEAREWYG